MAIQKILVVDDSFTDRFYLTELLVDAGFTVTTAENGEECLEKVAADAPDLVLMDVVMPGLNGFQATRALSKNPLTAHIPVIMYRQGAGDGSSVGLAPGRQGLRHQTGAAG